MLQSGNYWSEVRDHKTTLRSSLDIGCATVHYRGVQQDIRRTIGHWVCNTANDEKQQCHVNESKLHDEIL